MKILVVAATYKEVEAFARLNNKVEILICGLGIPSTVYHITKKILLQKYDVVIQAGIGGSFTKNIKKGEVVIIERDAFGDIGAEEKGKFKTIFEFGFENKNEFPFDNGWLINTSNIFKKSHLKKVKAITINKITDSKTQQMQLKKIFNADVESMEGAALHYVCLQQNIDFIQVRSISNKVGERNKTKWLIKEAIENLAVELESLIDLINK